jgi:putative tryptophan/tyrosine transport system substrate-binding protein
MRRREFIAGLAAAAAGRSITARAQQPERMRRVGVLIGGIESDPFGQSTIASFRQHLRELGWTEGRNVTIYYRWGAGDPDRYRRNAAELVALALDVIVTTSGANLNAVRQVSATVPVVFVGAGDPAARGLIDGLARPGRNVTGFFNEQYSVNGKMLELLKEIAPRVTRAAVLYDPTGIAQRRNLGAVQDAAEALRVELRPIDASNAGAIERGIAEFASAPNGGLIAPLGVAVNIHRELIIKLAARYRLPAVYTTRVFIADGGLISYGPVITDIVRGAASYVDRILKGENPANLPVQAPTKYEMALNLKTAKALGIDVPPTVLVRVDEVIE